MAETLDAVNLIGRRRQLDRVRDWVAELEAGRGRTVLIEGEPGIGKSSLLRAAGRAAVGGGCQVLWGSCDELSQAFPLLPLLDALDERHGGRSSVTEALRAAAAPGNRVDQVAAAIERLLALVDELCARSPVMLVVDDLQWADPATVVALGRLARAVGQLPLLLVCLARPVPHRDDLDALRRALDPANVLPLRSLTEPEVVDLVAHLVGGPPGPRLLRLAADAAGNPLYLTELVEALQRGRALTEAGEQVELGGGRAPESLGAAIDDRLEFLSNQARGVLRAAALLGTEFSVSELALVSARRVGDLMPVLDEAILAGVLRDDGPALAFRHPLLRAALYNGMPPAVRAAWHRDAAAALARDGATAERVARQLLPALEGPGTSRPADDWVVHWLTDAAHQLVGQAPRVAIPLLRWAVSGIPAGTAPHDVLTCRLADALFRAGDRAGAAEVAEAALSHVTGPDLLVDLHWTLAQCLALDGRAEESLATLARTLDSVEVGPTDRARLRVLAARMHRSLGRVDKAGQVADTALAEATAAGDRWAACWALGMSAMAHGMRGDTAEALPLFDRALTVAEGDPALTDLRLMLQINQAVTLGDLDRYEDAIMAAEQVRRLAEEAGNVVRLAQAQSVLGELLFDVGRWDDALAEVDVDGGGTNDPGVGCSDHGVAATIRLHRGDGTARHHLAEAEQFAARLPHRLPGALALARSLEREQADAPEEALAVLMDGLAGTAEAMEESADLLADAVRLAVSVGDESAARTAVSRAEQVARASDVPHHRAVAPHCRGLLERDPGSLLEAAEHYQAAGRMLPRAQALEAAGVALAEGGDIAAARTRFTDAFSLYTELGAGWDLARTQATFRAYGIRRGPHVRHRRADQGWESLTPTELKVVGMVAAGLSNPQIAARLFLSRRTVQTHVSHILAKLDLHSRIDIAREAASRESRDAGGN